jgi:asparagine synthase (glutamine-hydrolysing)
MCGIFGEFAYNNRLTEEPLFHRLNNLNRLRGPDSDGYWTDGEFCRLGFRRLAILDLSPMGNQPMISFDGRWAMVFNGEVYNYREIAKRLLPGIQLKGHSDSEVIINAFAQFGVKKTAAMLDGMFAIALYDTREKELHLIRDFAGIKPLFYGIKNGRVIFGSQYNQLYSHPDFADCAIDREVLKLYLQLHYVPAPHGILRDTFQVEPGQIISISREGQVNAYRYWNFPEPAYEIFKLEEALEFTGSTLEEAVQAEMISDVPLGSFLSGGIDSPLVSWYAQKHATGKLQSFTIGSDSKIHDESEDAQWYGREIGADVNQLTTNSRIAMNALDKVMDSLYEPFADFSIIPTYLVSRLAREKVTVSLSGDGGDELFFGYERFASVLKNMAYRKIIPSSFRYPAYALDKILFKNRHVNSLFIIDRLAEAHFLLHSRFKESLVNKVFPHLHNIPRAKDGVYEYQDSRNNKQMLWNMQKAEFYGMMQKTLIKVDRASMANSLEVRVPFLKKSFIEASFKIAPELSYDQKRKKDVLKKLLLQKMPGAPVNDKKRGFTVPLGKWIQQELKEEFRDKVMNRNFIEDFGINGKELENLFESHLSGKDDRKWALFTLYSLSRWNMKRKKAVLQPANI